MLFGTSIKKDFLNGRKIYIVYVYRGKYARLTKQGPFRTRTLAENYSKRLLRKADGICGALSLETVKASLVRT